MGMETIRAADTRWNIHRTATAFARKGDYAAAEQVYRDALRLYPNKPGMLLGLAGVLALQEKTEEAISLIERGLPLSENEQQKATMRAVLCLLYERAGEPERARNLAANLPHTRESREAILAQLSRTHDEADIQKGIQLLLLGE